MTIAATTKGNEAMPPESSLTGRDMELLCRLPIFSQMSQEEIRRVIGNAIPRQHPRGKVLFQHGEKATSFYIVLDGLVKVLRHGADGSEVILGVFGPGNAVAEATIFLEGRYPATAELAADSRLLAVRNAHFRQILEENSHLAMGMLSAAYKRIHYLVSELEHLKSQTSCQRVADFILHLTHDEDGGQVEVDLPYEKGLIAARLGMKPESFSRALKRLRKLGVIIHRDHVHITDMEALRHFAMTGEVIPVDVG